MISFILYLLLAIIAFGILVFVHELGHFIAAKSVGIRVEVFSIGWGKGFIKKKVGDTIYQLGIIPVGGFCKMAGEYGDELGEPQPYHFFSKKPLQKIFVSIAGVLFNLLFAIIVITILGLFPTVTEHIPPVIYITPDLYTFPAYVSGLRSGDLITAINDKKISDYSELRQIIGQAMGKPITIDYSRDGVASRAVITPNVVRTSGQSLIGIYDAQKAIIASVDSKSVFADLNLPENTSLTEIITPDGTINPATYKAQMYYVILGNLNKDLIFNFMSNGKLYSKKVHVTDNTNYGLTFYAPLIKNPGLSLPAAFVKSFSRSYEITVTMARSIPFLFSGKVNVGDSMAGPIKLIYMTSKVAESGMKPLFEFLALISIALGITNLLPIPAVDGSYIVFFLIELISGRSLNKKLITRIQTVGFFFLLALMAIIVFNDIMTIGKM